MPICGQPAPRAGRALGDETEAASYPKLKRTQKNNVLAFKSSWLFANQRVNLESFNFLFNSTDIVNYCFYIIILVAKDNVSTL
jgi:hypothetical protein